MTDSDSDRDRDEVQRAMTDGGAVQATGLQAAMSSSSMEDRLADEPLGPERPSFLDGDYAEIAKAMDISAGDRIVWEDGVESVVRDVVPAHNVDVADQHVHIETPETGQTNVFFGADLAEWDREHDDIEVVCDE